MTTKELLTCARDLILDPKHWTQGHLARDKNSRVVEPHDERADKFCAIGALQHCSDNGGKSVFDACDKLADCIEPTTTGTYPGLKRSIIGVNDIGSRPVAHAAIINLFDCAIAKEKS